MVCFGVDRQPSPAKTPTTPPVDRAAEPAGGAARPQTEQGTRTCTLRERAAG